MKFIKFFQNKITFQLFSSIFNFITPIEAKEFWDANCLSWAFCSQIRTNSINFVLFVVNLNLFQTLLQNLTILRVSSSIQLKYREFDQLNRFRVTFWDLQ